VGVLPGLGPAAAIALLLPPTFAVTPGAAIIMLAGIYYGAMYGGSTTRNQSWLQTHSRHARNDRRPATNGSSL